MGPAQSEADERTRVIGADPVPPAAPVQDEPTRVVSSFKAEPEAEATRVMPTPKLEKPASFEPVLDRAADDEGTRVIPSTRKEPVRPAEPEDYEEDEPNDARDSVAETLIRWVPPLTAIVCAAIALWGFVYYQFMM